jgi:phosphatidylglycerol:prolipoprotein diacylglycerol transferase
MPKTTSVAEERQPGEAPEVPPLARITRGSSRGWPLEFVSSGSKGQLSQLEPQAVGVTYWFDAAESGEPYDVVVRFTGTRLDVKGMPASTDHFQCRATLEGVEPGSGRMSMTHRITEVTGGRWKVTAEAVRITPDGEKRRTVSLPKGQAIGCSTYAPIALVRAPGVVLGSWPAFVGAGVVAALALQATLVRDHGLASGRILGLASVASVLGLLGAKAYYRLTHRHEDVSILAAGLSVQGFVIVSVATFVVGGAALGLPLGHLLDTTVPALLLGQAIGRLGCFFAGCCSGRPTT